MENYIKLNTNCIELTKTNYSQILLEMKIKVLKFINKKLESLFLPIISLDDFSKSKETYDVIEIYNDIKMKIVSEKVNSIYEKKENILNFDDLLRIYYEENKLSCTVFYELFENSEIELLGKLNNSI